ncbi:MAG: hypothetical protein Udaeo2_15270 [Candidatus Udaeobacter sp.]|jgi:hypothetical protein|nr:MAG: hypothetical protein Udaeo2_15270 [Candidatus Udaeobacter sp.]
MWFKVVAALVVCGPIACSEQIVPQLIAQLASLDHDHGISLHASGDGVDLVLAHDHHSFPENDEAQALALSASEPAHVVHILTGSVTAKQSAALMVSNSRDLVPYFSTAIVTEWRTFVPQIPLAYSRPPPDEMSILPAHRSTLLLI